MYIARTLAFFATLALMVTAAPATVGENPSASDSTALSCIKRSAPDDASSPSLPGGVLVATPSDSASSTSSTADAASGSASSEVANPSPVPSDGRTDDGTSSERDGKRFIAYWSIWHQPTVLNATQLKQLGVTDVIMAFMYMKDQESAPVWEPTAAVKFNTGDIKALKKQNITVTAAIGGWGLDNVFRPATNTTAGREKFAQALAKFVGDMGLDGIDLDWEYPGGNGQNYKLPLDDPNSRPENVTDGPNFVLAAAEIRKELDKLGRPMTLSIAVPAKPVDLIIYNNTEVTLGLDKYVDYWNLMTYDYINRRDTHTGNHAGDRVIEDTLSIYAGYGIARDKMNIGFPMYAKWFHTDLTKETCPHPHIGCEFGVEYENSTGGDTDKSAAMVFNAQIEMTELGTAAHNAWSTFASAGGEDSSAAPGGGSTTIIETEAQNYFFTWVSKDDVKQSCEKHLPDAGGVFIWALNQDTKGAAGGPRFDAVAECFEGVRS